ncbi:Pycsar system effector family protein [Gaetbulibacter sp. M240]|uniref:Pycsar system effector family protein n=1 Tax=Gaetbulibacter sp. M240 TaxID=3126511 RepID=UPI00374E5965
MEEKNESNELINDPNNYWEQLERLEKLIRASEIKAGIIFSFHSLVLGLIFDRFDRFEPILTSSYIAIILSVLWFISVLISIFYCFICFKPQIEMKYDKNVFFFGDAANAFGGIKEYTKKLIDVCTDEKKLFQQLAEQIHVECVIIDAKFRSIRKSMNYFGLSIIFFISVMIYWVIKPI